MSALETRSSVCRQTGSTLTAIRWRAKCLRKHVGANRLRRAARQLLAMRSLPYTRAICESYARLQRSGVTIKSMAHITGGGLIDNVARALPDQLAARFDAASWRVPPVVALVAREARLSLDEAYRTLNMGVGFCLVVSPQDAARAAQAANETLVTNQSNGAAGPAAIVGEVEPRHQCGPSVIVGGA